VNLKQTQHWLRNLGISKHYGINSLGYGDCHCIAFDFVPDEGWTVFYSERGHRFSIEKFASEKAACEVFIKAVIEAHKGRIDNLEYHRTHNTEHF